MSAIDEKAAELQQMREELGQLEFDVVTGYTTADAIREGSQVTEQAVGWGDCGKTACAMTAAAIAARSRDLL